MTKNTLETGQHRLGWVVLDDDPHKLAALLENTGDRIQLTIPTSGLISRQPHDRWFSQGISYGDDPERTKHEYAPPTDLLFHDNDGSVLLMECRAIRSRSGLNAGSGTIIASRAVLGARTDDYAALQEVRSEIPFIAYWARLGSVTKLHDTDTDRRVQKISIQTTKPDALSFNGPLPTTLEPHWRVEYLNNDRTTLIHDQPIVVSHAEAGDDWRTHLTCHRQLRDLTSIAAWRSAGFNSVEIQNAADPERVASGKAVGPAWNSVVSYEYPIHHEDTTPSFLFALDDIGVDGVNTWFDVRREFARAIEPMLVVIDSSDRYIGSMLAQSGIAIEALGYQLSQEQGGRLLDGRGQLTYRHATTLIAEGLPFEPLNMAEWAERSRTSYMGVKHPDNPMPDALTQIETMRENFLIIRLWLANRLGCDSGRLRANLDLDPLQPR